MPSSTQSRLNPGHRRVVVVCVGLAIGWRVHTGVADVAEAFALSLLFGYAGLSERHRRRAPPPPGPWTGGGGMGYTSDV